MKLVIGLGNPGKKYEGTRHNVGFDVLAELARRGVAGRPRTAFSGLVAEVTCGGERVLLVAPQTLMNRSGQCVAAVREFYKLELVDLLVVCDDLNLPLGKLRLRPGGTAGGQKGLADVIRALGSEEFARLRLGIGSPPAGWDAADYVLGRFAKEERAEMELAVARGAEAVETWAREGLAASMNRFN